MKRSAWSRTIVISSVILLISLGLCGLNFAVFTHLNLPISGPAVRGQEDREAWGGRLVATGMLELMGILLGGIGLLVGLVGAGLSAIFSKRERNTESDESDLRIFKK